jgi:hypothetical protein
MTNQPKDLIPWEELEKLPQVEIVEVTETAPEHLPFLPTPDTLKPKKQDTPQA